MNNNLKLKADDLHFIPLGGSEQFGVNLNVYAYKDKLLAIDCGIGFADERFPGIDLLLPDPQFIEDRRENLVGLIITHAHEDHIGAVPHLWPRLRCPIYTTEFAAAVLRRKFDEAGPECRNARINIIRPGAVVELGPFTARFVHVAHSIPGTCAVILETAAGRVVHSGDWNLDPRPVIGKVTDAEGFKDAGKKGVLAYIGDSTNANVPGRAGSESDVEAGLKALFSECKGRIAVTIFASNIGRLRSIAKAAEANGRSVALIGRSLHSMTAAARNIGILNDVGEFLSEEEIADLPAENVVMVVTGSQGEPRAALARIARGEKSEIPLTRGDTVVFSSRPIPGNEVEINAVKNLLISSGITVLGPGDTSHTIHVSGHPCRDEIVDMYNWTRPRLVVPVHGERTQLEAQAALARECQIENVIVPGNGTVIRLGPGAPAVIDHIETGLLAVEPSRIVSADHPAIAERRKLQFTGAVHVTLALDGKGNIADDPIVTTLGLIDEEVPEELKLEDDLVSEILDILADMEKADLKDDHAVHEEIRIGVRRYVLMTMKVKPKTTVHIVRL
jgi:ribonuclease J